MAARRLIVGIGNPDRGDDGVGHEVVRLLQRRVPGDVELRCHTGEATTLLESFEGADAVYLIDAAASGAAPGTVRRFDASAGPLPSGLSEASSHGFGVVQAIELARALGVMPACCVVHAIEGGDFEPGAVLSPKVRRAAEEVTARLLEELGSSTTPLSRPAGAR